MRLAEGKGSLKSLGGILLAEGIEAFKRKMSRDAMQEAADGQQKESPQQEAFAIPEVLIEAVCVSANLKMQPQPAGMSQLQSLSSIDAQAVPVQARPSSIKLQGHVASTPHHQGVSNPDVPVVISMAGPQRSSRGPQHTPGWRVPQFGQAAKDASPEISETRSRPGAASPVALLLRPTTSPRQGSVSPSVPRVSPRPGWRLGTCYEPPRQGTSPTTPCRRHASPGIERPLQPGPAEITSAPTIPEVQAVHCRIGASTPTACWRQPTPTPPASVRRSEASFNAPSVTPVAATVVCKEMMQESTDMQRTSLRQGAVTPVVSRHWRQSSPTRGPRLASPSSLEITIPAPETAQSNVTPFRVTGEGAAAEELAVARLAARSKSPERRSKSPIQRSKSPIFNVRPPQASVEASIPNLSLSVPAGVCRMSSAPVAPTTGLSASIGGLGSVTPMTPCAPVAPTTGLSASIGGLGSATPMTPCTPSVSAFPASTPGHTAIGLSSAGCISNTGDILSASSAQGTFSAAASLDRFSTAQIRSSSVSAAASSPTLDGRLPARGSLKPAVKYADRFTPVVQAISAGAGTASGSLPSKVGDE